MTIQRLRRSFGTLAEWVKVPAVTHAIEAWMLKEAGIHFEPEQPSHRFSKYGP